MAFEFFFGLLGLISGDSKSRHKSRLESEWRLPTPLNGNLFRDSNLKASLASSGGPSLSFAGKTSGTGQSGPLSSSPSSNDKRPIFSTTGTLAAANSGSVSEGLFSTTSSSSASSIASSGSTLTNSSSSPFVKAAEGEQPSKYEFYVNLAGGGGSGAGAANKARPFPNLMGGSGKPLDDGLMASLKGHLSDELAGSGRSPDPLLEGVGRNGVGGAAAAAGAGSGGGLGVAGGPDAGLLDEQEVASESDSGAVPRSRRLRKLYCLLVCAGLWLHVGRLIVGLLVDKSILTLDFYCLGAYKIHFLIPAMCLAIQAAAVSTLFIRNNNETNWLVPFYSSKDYLIRSRSNFKPKIEDYTKRVNVSVVLALILALVSSASLSAYLVHCVGQSDLLLEQQANAAAAAAAAAAVAANGAGSAPAPANTQYETIGSSPAPGELQAASTISTIVTLQRDQQLALAAAAAAAANRTALVDGNDSLSAAAAAAANNRMERAALAGLLTFDVLWAVYSTYICFMVSFYFNLICAIMKSRFHGISKIIEDLAESNTTKTTNQARKITTLYLEHNEACELLDESNDFWQYLIFFTYFTYIPAYCYCLYNLFFVDFEAWPSFITWVIHTHTGFIILLISFSAAGVSTEVATFLHRVRGLTIGYSCYDLFAITNASMSNTAAACASYFLIVADFSRSSVFTLSQMNGSASAAAGAGAAAAPTTPTPAIG